MTSNASVTRRSGTQSFDALAVGRQLESGGFASAGAGVGYLGTPARFRILCEIGRGGMGIVYNVRDVETIEMLALKVLKPEIASDQEMQESLRTEVCVARKVTHKNVCRIHDQPSERSPFGRTEFDQEYPSAPIAVYVPILPSYRPYSPRGRSPKHPRVTNCLEVVVLPMQH
jgi:serine/threonine protein kinase